MIIEGRPEHGDYWTWLYSFTSFTPPKKVTTWRTCPACGSRATKIFTISREKFPIKCQVCGFCYDPPSRRGR